MLKHTNLRNIDVATSFGKIHFDENGLSDDLTVDQQKQLGELYNFTYITSSDAKEEIEKEEETTADEEQTEEDIEAIESPHPMDVGTVDGETVEIKDYEDITVKDIKGELKDANVDFDVKLSKSELYEIYKDTLMK